MGGLDGDHVSEAGGLLYNIDEEMPMLNCFSGSCCTNSERILKGKRMPLWFWGSLLDESKHDCFKQLSNRVNALQAISYRFKP